MKLMVVSKTSAEGVATLKRLARDERPGVGTPSWARQEIRGIVVAEWESFLNCQRSME